MDYFHDTLGYVRADAAFKLNGKTYARNALRGMTKEQRTALGFQDTQVGNEPDERYYTWVENKNGPVVTYSATAKPLDDVVDLETGEVVVVGLKTQLIRHAKTNAGSLLAVTDWKIIRASETSTPADDATLAARAAIRQASNDYEAAVTACTTIDELIAVGTSPAWPE